MRVSVTDGLCSSLPSLCDIFADPKSEPLIEPGNATAIGQGNGHIVRPLQVRQQPTHTLARNPTTAIVRVRDDIQHLGHVRVATDTRESYKGALGRVSSDVVVAEAQHFGRFSLDASVLTVPANVSIEGIQLGKVNARRFP